MQYNNISSSSSSCHVAHTDQSDPHAPPVSIVHCSWKVFKATSCIGTERLYICFSWSSYLCLSMWWGPQEYIAHEFVFTSPVVSCMSVCLTVIVFVIGGWWPYSCCFMESCLQYLFNTACSNLCSQVNGFEYTKWLNSSIWPIDGTLTVTTTSGKSGPESTGNKELFHIFKTSWTWVSPSDAVYYHIQDTHLWEES